MERKRKGLLGVIVILAACLFLLTLLFCGCNSGQIERQDDKQQRYAETLLTVVRIIWKAKQRTFCLSADISVASDTDTCFDCHDKIEWR